MYYACEGVPVNKDCGDLAPAEPAGQFKKAGFVIEEAKSVLMRVIRHIDMGGGNLFKPHWRVTSRTGKYIDLGSGKAAVVRLTKYGAQEKNKQFDTKRVMAGDSSEVRGVLDELLGRGFQEHVAPVRGLKRSSATLGEAGGLDTEDNDCAASKKPRSG